MKTTFRRSFTRDLRKIRSADLKRRIGEAVREVEKASEPSAVRNVKAITGSAGFFRIRIGDYRLGIFVSGSVVEFVRCLHRRDIYRYFPRS